MECYLCPLWHSIKFNTSSLSICYVQGTVLNDSGAQIRWGLSRLLHYTPPGAPTARSYAAQWPWTCPQSYSQMFQQLQMKDKTTRKKYKLPEESKRVRKSRRERRGGGREREEGKQGEKGRERETGSLWAPSHWGGAGQEKKRCGVWDESWRMGRILVLAMMATAAMATAAGSTHGQLYLM